MAQDCVIYSLRDGQGSRMRGWSRRWYTRRGKLKLSCSLSLLLFLREEKIVNEFNKENSEKDLGDLYFTYHLCSLFCKECE